MLKVESNNMDYTIAIIPVRGGSKGIPRKNARLLNGRPLMSYAIEKALKSNVFCQVAVSTEDEELAHIAEQWGAKVLWRDNSLATDNVALDEVICNQVNCYEKNNNVHLTYIATVQATSPLLSMTTIQEAVRKCIVDEFDTVLSVVNDNHLAWKIDENGKTVPAYSARLNRQMLPSRFRETGGIVVCRRGVLETGTRFGKKVGIVECDKHEAIDIDDRYDWWMVEKHLQRKKIVIRVDGYKEIGMGHIYRALTLADHRLDHDFHFVLRGQSDIGIRQIKKRNYQYSVCGDSAEDQVRTIADLEPNIIINDVLDTSTEYMQLLRDKTTARVVNFEDVGDGRQLADVVINALYDTTSIGKHNHVFVGEDYVCLRDEFLAAKLTVFKTEIKKIILLFGGTDPGNLSGRILHWVAASIPAEVEIILIVGPGNPNIQDIRTEASSLGRRIEIVAGTGVLTKYIREADLAITSGGRTVFELGSQGVPMLVINQNQRETQHHFANNTLGVVNLGLASNLNKEVFTSTLNEMLQSSLLRLKMRKALLSVDWKNGIERTWRLILDEKKA